MVSAAQQKRACAFTRDRCRCYDVIAGTIAEEEAAACSSRRRFSLIAAIDPLLMLWEVAMVAKPLPNPLSSLCHSPSPVAGSRP